MKKGSIILTVFFTLLFAVSSVAAVGDNLCLNADIVSATGYVNEEETPAHMIDGIVDTKWCSNYHPEKVEELYTNGTLSKDTVKHVLTIDLKENKFFNKYAMIHASLCERDFDQTDLNASDWVLEASLDGLSWFVVDEVTNNTLNITEREIPLTEARYVRLVVIKSDRVGGDTVRIPELRIFESDDLGSATETDGLEEIKQIEAEKEQQEAQAKAQEKVVLMLIIIGMVISLGILYTLKFINVKKHKEENK